MKRNIYYVITLDPFSASLGDKGGIKVVLASDFLA